MSASAHRGDHDIAFYEAALEETRTLTVTAGALAQLPDADGALRPGRYLIQAVGLASGQTCWVHVGAFAVGTPLAPAIGDTVAGPRRFPLTEVVPGIESHMLGGYSDRVAARLDGGAAITLHVSRVSSDVTKG